MFISPAKLAHNSIILYHTGKKFLQEVSVLRHILHLSIYRIHVQWNETSKCRDFKARLRAAAAAQSDVFTASDHILEHHLHSTPIATTFMAITLIFPIAKQTSLRHTRTPRRKKNGEKSPAWKTIPPQSSVPFYCEKLYICSIMHCEQMKYYY